MSGTDQRAGDRFVEHPDEVKIEKDDGATYTFCWLDDERVCTGGCQAFDPMYADDESGRFTSCRLINLGIALGSVATTFLNRSAPKKAPIPGVNIRPPEV